MAIATHEHFPQWASAGISCLPDRGSCPEKAKARQGEQVAPSEFKAVAPGNVPVGHNVGHWAQKKQVGPEKTSRSKCADVAQLVEQLIRNQQVSGSNPLVGSRLPRKTRTYSGALFLWGSLGGSQMLSHKHRIVLRPRFISSSRKGWNR